MAKKKNQKKDDLLEYKKLCGKSIDLATSVHIDLEERLRSIIQESRADYTDLLAIKGVLDHTMRRVSNLQEIDARIRRLISVGDDFMEEASFAFPFEPDRIITD